MPRIRHIALLTKEQEKLAAFYKTAFGMTEVFRHESQGGGGPAIYLSDGYINLAVLPARERPEGLYHFGFQVDDIEGTARVALEAGATQPPVDLPRDGRYAEVFIKDPMGTRIDLSEAGWNV
jgi:catechol 2,3-dioxygenase-like lactoylglutathione lyase family enzyme